MLLIFGLGYSGTAVALAARARGISVLGTTRGHASTPDRIGFETADAAIAAAWGVLVTAAPGPGGDPVLARHGTAIRRAIASGGLHWVGYLSSTVVYGNRDGAWVDETTVPAPSSPRGAARVAAEAAWREAAAGAALDIFRLAGIYGPGRSVLDDLRAGTARRVDRPGHAFGRIHRDDIARAVLAAMDCAASGARVFHLADDLPAPSADVVAYAAGLLGVAPPELVPFATAWAGRPPMARGFWAENRRVSSAATCAALGIAWRYPTYRDGLAAILAEERGKHVSEEREILRA